MTNTIEYDQLQRLSPKSKMKSIFTHQMTMLISLFLISLTSSFSTPITSGQQRSTITIRTTPRHASQANDASITPETGVIHTYDDMDHLDMDKTKKLCAKRNIPFESIKNARDLASSNPHIKEKRLYRMGKLSDASPSDIDLLKKLDLRTIVDLRSPTEWKEDEKLNEKDVFGEYTTCIWKERNGKVKQGGTTMEASKRKRIISSLSKPSSSTPSPNERHFVSLMDEFKYVKGTISKLRKRDLAKVLMKSPGALFSRRVRTACKDVFLNEINDGGLPMLNELLMRMGAPGIRYVLELIADERRHPMAFYCTAGKDRTGMIAAIVLSIVGTPVEDIVEDYSLSANVYAEINDHRAMVGALSQRNLDPETFLGAPPQVMRETLESVVEVYGSMEGYLDWIGFGEDKRAKMREVLLKQEE